MTNTSQNWTVDQIYDKIIAKESILALHVAKDGFEIISMDDTDKEPDLFELLGALDADS